MGQIDGFGGRHREIILQARRSSRRRAGRAAQGFRACEEIG